MSASPTVLTITTSLTFFLSLIFSTFVSVCVSSLSLSLSLSLCVCVCVYSSGPAYQIGASLSMINQIMAQMAKIYLSRDRTWEDAWRPTRGHNAPLASLFPNCETTCLSSRHDPSLSNSILSQVVLLMSVYT